jgi:hypothetical protein
MVGRHGTRIMMIYVAGIDMVISLVFRGPRTMGLSGLGMGDMSGGWLMVAVKIGKEVPGITTPRTPIKSHLTFELDRLPLNWTGTPLNWTDRPALRPRSVIVKFPSHSPSPQVLLCIKHSIIRLEGDFYVGVGRDSHIHRVFDLRFRFGRAGGGVVEHGLGWWFRSRVGHDLAADDLGRGDSFDSITRRAGSARRRFRDYRVGINLLVLGFDGVFLGLEW